MLSMDVYKMVCPGKKVTYENFCVSFSMVCKALSTLVNKIA